MATGASANADAAASEPPGRFDRRLDKAAEPAEVIAAVAGLAGLGGRPATLAGLPGRAGEGYE